MRIFKLLLLLFIGFNVLCQENSEYLNIKDKYNLKDYKSVVQEVDIYFAENPNDKSIPYFLFYKGLALNQLNKLNEARFVFVKISQSFSDWDKIDETFYQLAECQLKSGQFVEAHTSIEAIKKSDLRSDAEKMFYYFVENSNDYKNLTQTQFKLKNDKKLAQIVAHKLYSSPDSTDNFVSKYLIQEYKLDFGNIGSKETKKKDTYTVALLLPFSLSNNRAYLNLPALNIRDGVQLAVDSLKKQGVKIELKVFDSEKNQKRIGEILNSKGFSDVDLVLGPVGGPSCIEVLKFCNQHHIINFNFSREENGIANGTHGFTLRNTYYRSGISLAESIQKLSDSTKNVHVFFKRNLKDQNDSLMAFLCKQTLENRGRKVYIHTVSSDMKSYKSSLSSITNLNTSAVVCLGDNNLMASTTLGVWEAEKKEIPLFVSKEWLDIQLITYDQFFRQNVHFIYNEFLNPSDNFLKMINGEMIKKYGVKPSNYNYLSMGYDAMYFSGTLLGKYGNQFQKEFINLPVIPLPFNAGVLLQQNKSNSLLPIVKLNEEFHLEWVNQIKH